jgi:membrane protein
MGFAAELYRKFDLLYRRSIWQPDAIRDRSALGRLFAVLRVFSITWNGLFENHITARAAALSYASLLGLGPLVAIAMLVAGFMLNQQDPTVAVNALNRVIKFIAPQVAQYEILTQRSGAPTVARPGEPPVAPAAPPAGASDPKTADVSVVAANPALVQLIDSFVAGSRSGTAGVLGGLTLIIIVIQLFTSVENAFNAVWGVRRGRSWLLRVVYYWTILTLGTVLFFASLTALSAAAFINVFFEKLPFGQELLVALRWLLPSLSVVVLVSILTFFYRFTPNTRVIWRAALTGAIVVTALLFLNNYAAFLYFKRVVLQRSLYGSLGILPILMLGLFIFWFFVLVGGQISYAVQNVHYRSSQAAWNSLSVSLRERLSLLVLLVIARRFRECGSAYSASELGGLVKVPTQVLNECLNRLGDLGLVAAIPPAPGQSSLDYRYQPARPLDRITLPDFKARFEDCGEDPSGNALDLADPVLRYYHEKLHQHAEQALGPQTLDTLLAAMPLPGAKSPAG